MIDMELYRRLVILVDDAVDGCWIVSKSEFFDLVEELLRKIGDSLAESLQGCSGSHGCRGCVASVVFSLKKGSSAFLKTSAIQKQLDPAVSCCL